MTSLFSSERVLDPAGYGQWGLSQGQFQDILDFVTRAARTQGLEVTLGDRAEPYPLLPSLVQLDAGAEQDLARTVPHVYQALLRIVRAHRHDAQLRAFLDVPRALRRWTDASPARDDRVDFCRFDFVGGGADAKVVEFNANCPGGTLFTGAYDRLWQEQPAIASVLSAWDVRPSTISRPFWFPDFVLAHAHRARGTTPQGPVAVFHKPGGNTLELAKLVELLAQRGRRAFLTCPAAPDWHDAQTGYLKYSVQAALGDIDRWERFLGRLVDGRMTVVNPLPGRWIGDNKLCLAAMSDTRFARLFTDDENNAIQRLIPYSRKVGDGVEPRELRRARADWVLKGPYDTRGDSVHIGSEQTPDRWNRLVGEAAEKGWLAQQMIPPGTRNWQEQTLYQDLSIVLLDGAWAGYTSRLSQNLKVNVAKGGGRQVILGHASVRWPAEAA
ncbi:hypothetical protein [Streptomyces microflavus]|uniref:hypothetical protein n=1 Tax=Streptomyces microflavus TaxID=1919 RepID=UPI0036E08105